MSFFRNESLRKQLYDYIKKKMNSGDLMPGDPINQREIFEELNISRTPYRDCMIQLESEGLVQIIPCRGVVVRRLSVAEVMEAQEVGAALEGMVYELAFDNARARCAPRLDALIEKADRCFARNEAIPQDLNMEFHTVVFEQCPNRSIVDQLVKLRERIYDFPQLNLAPLLKWEKEFWEEHCLQVELLRNGTASELGRYTREVHWRVSGREEYWETLLGVAPGTVRHYFKTRRACCDTKPAGDGIRGRAEAL